MSQSSAVTFVRPCRRASSAAHFTRHRGSCVSSGALAAATEGDRQRELVEFLRDMFGYRDEECCASEATQLVTGVSSPLLAL
jgi:hypothetical protein